MANYYLAVNGQPTGPYTIEQLAQFRIAPEALVWNETMTEWTPASSVFELQFLFRTAQPVYQQPSQQQTYQQQTYQQPNYQQTTQPFSQPDYEPTQRIVSFAKAIKLGFIKIVDFSGRASRSEYWFFQLFNFLVSFSLTILATTGGEAFVMLQFACSLGMILPNLSLTWRRLHDTGRSGAYFFISFIPIVGFIILLVAVCNASEPWENDYGPVPNVE